MQISKPLKIVVNKRFKNSKEIVISIGKCDQIPFKDENLGSIFKIANQETINKKYPCFKNSRIIDGRIVHRPNHNGTHSVSGRLALWKRCLI